MKKINRNAFNEKLIHRYLFERYYFAPRDIRNKLLPEKYHKEDINLIAPEDAGDEAGYRADMTLFFKNAERGVPVEVKWHEAGLTKQNQVQYLKKHDGFVVSFAPGHADSTIPHFCIDPEDFLDWTQKNISKLTRETLIYQAGIESTKGANQYWVVFLRGTSHANFKKMLEERKGTAFWAYKQNGHALKNILDIQKGDRCLFILGYASEGMGMSNDPKLNFEISAWYETVIREPYYMILHGEKGTFFEEGDIPVNKRRWPHFMDFVIKSKFESANKIQVGKRGEFSRAFAESVNYGAGAPSPLLRRQWDALIDLLRHAEKKSVK